MSRLKGLVWRHFDSPKSSLRIRRAISGYLWAATVSALSFMVICAVLFLRHSEESTLAVGISLASAAMAAIVFWIVALVAAMLPAAVAYAAARRFGFHSVSYYLSSGAVTGLLLAPIVLWFAETNEVGIFIDLRWWTTLMLMATGGLAGITFWYKAVSSASGADDLSGPPPTIKRVVDAVLSLTVFLTLGLGLMLIGAFWPILWLIWSPNTCVTETRQKISNLSGFDFESTFTDCDAIAKWADVRVFGSRAGKGEKTLLFEYDPNIDEVPEISVTDPTHIVITIPLVSSIKFQMRDSGDVHIEYRIGRVIYEGPS